MRYRILRDVFGYSGIVTVVVAAVIFFGSTTEVQVGPGLGANFTVDPGAGHVAVILTIIGLVFICIGWLQRYDAPEAAG
jgi:hypothetical protein